MISDLSTDHAVSSDARVFLKKKFKITGDSLYQEQGSWKILEAFLDRVKNSFLNFSALSR